MSMGMLRILSSKWPENLLRPLITQIELSKRFIAVNTTDKVKGRKFSTDDEIEVITNLKQKFEKDECGGEVVPIFKKALLYPNKTAIRDQFGKFTYGRLYVGAKKLSIQISNLCGSGSSNRIAFLAGNDVRFPLVQFAIWFSGQIAVPLSPHHPQDLMKYYVQDCDANLLITTPEYENIMKPIAENLQKILIVVDYSFIPEETVTNPEDSQYSSYLDPKNKNVLQSHGDIIVEGSLNNDFYTKTNAMILYTSGTTGKPKGVVLSHKHINCQVQSLATAWKINEKDSVLHVLPLNHVHGCVNGLLLPLNFGANVVMHECFNPTTVWKSLLSLKEPSKDRVNMFMGVPTIYRFLIDEYEKIFAKSSKMVEYIENYCKKNVRLMISGSAPLPTTTFNQWRNITGHHLLERYGMTEIGMALSNPYYTGNYRKRKAGTVGLPLPFVECRIADASNKPLFTMKGEIDKGFWSNIDRELVMSEKPITGELQVKGPTVFNEYYNRPEETKKQFVDGYFKTGDIACFEDGVFKIMGRSNVDIIKSGGYKVSALQVETHLLAHPSIRDAAVVGVEDPVWGERIAAVVVLRAKSELDLESLKVFCSDKLAPYQCPTILKIVNELPRNALGKINKKNLDKSYFSQATQPKEETT